MVCVAALLTGVFVAAASCADEDEATVAAIIFGLHGVVWSLLLERSLAADRIASLVAFELRKSPTARYAAFVGLGLVGPMVMATVIFDEMTYESNWCRGEEDALAALVLCLLVSAAAAGAFFQVKLKATIEATWTAAVERFGLAGRDAPLPPKPTVKALTAALTDLPVGRAGGAASVVPKRSVGGALDLDGTAVAQAGAVGLKQSAAPLVVVFFASLMAGAFIDEASCMAEDPYIIFLVFFYLLHGIFWTRSLVNALSAERLAVLVEPDRPRSPAGQVGAFLVGGMFLPGLLGGIIAAENTWRYDYNCYGEDDAMALTAVMLIASAVVSTLIFRARNRKSVQHTWETAVSRSGLSDADAPVLAQPTPKALTAALQELAGD
jgi:hypothetical protein